ncbi:MAG TPA: hypothetical protein VLT36_13915 [Candidatus Dormibacteraeota bacterium]|nr:hypothetical protein [Candidatus Dormibacteraeota bacterium]
MNIRYAIILTFPIGLVLVGCTTTRDQAARNERQVETFKRDGGWLRIQQIAEREVKKREMLWAEPAEYLPVEHKNKVWSVTAMTGTPNGDLQRVVMMMIGDGGKVLAYKRYWKGQPVADFP